MYADDVFPFGGSVRDVDDATVGSEVGFLAA
jgi:hypothetical protein